MELIGIIRDVGGVLASIVVAWVALYVRSEIAAVKAEMDHALNEMRVEFLKVLSEDKQETRNWINGSFMRSALVDSKIGDISRRVDRLEA